jgi:hypothetical protein
VATAPPLAHTASTAGPGLVTPCSYASLQYVYYTTAWLLVMFREVAMLLRTASAINAWRTKMEVRDLLDVMFSTFCCNFSSKIIINVLIFT